jgi:Na+/melibiose symporter-like transporter
MRRFFTTEQHRIEHACGEASVLAGLVIAIPLMRIVPSLPLIGPSQLCGHFWLAMLSVSPTILVLSVCLASSALLGRALDHRTSFSTRLVVRRATEYAWTSVATLGAGWMAYQLFNGPRYLQWCYFGTGIVFIILAFTLTLRIARRAHENDYHRQEKANSSKAPPLTGLLEATSSFSTGNLIVQKTDEAVGRR